MNKMILTLILIFGANATHAAEIQLRPKDTELVALKARLEDEYRTAQALAFRLITESYESPSAELFDIALDACYEEMVRVDEAIRTLQDQDKYPEYAGDLNRAEVVQSALAVHKEMFKLIRLGIKKLDLNLSQRVEKTN
jgi:hypothetical protein